MTLEEKLSLYKFNEKKNDWIQLNFASYQQQLNTEFCAVFAQLTDTNCKLIDRYAHENESGQQLVANIWTTTRW